MKLSEKWEGKAEDYANRAGKAGPGSFYHECYRLCMEAEQDVVQLEEENAALKRGVGFFASVIKSGEKWTQYCQDMYDALFTQEPV